MAPTNVVSGSVGSAVPQQCRRYPRLFESVRIGPLTLRNRLFKTAAESCYIDASGEVTRELLHFYESLAAGGAGLVIVESPTLDRWMYPFNATPGTRGEAAVFTSLDIPEFDEFDERDGQALLGFDTSLEVPVDLPLSDYTVTAARLTIMNEGDENFLFDPTYDSYRTYLDPADPEYLPVIPEKQLEYMVDYARAVKRAGGAGVVFWEPAWVSTPCSSTVPSTGSRIPAASRSRVDLPVPFCPTRVVTPRGKSRVRRLNTRAWVSG